MSFDLKLHQLRCVQAYEDLRASGERFRRCITSLTGTGKSLIMTSIAESEVAKGGRVVLYSIRRLLTDQFIKQLQRDGIPFGCRAAEFDEHVDEDAPVQICSMQTELARVLRKRKKQKLEGDIARRMFPLARASLVVLDECVSGDTIIKTPSCEKAISECEIGEDVLSFYNDSVEYHKVVAKKKTSCASVYLVTTDCGEIKCTLNHLFWTKNGWVCAGDLKSSDSILVNRGPSLLKKCLSMLRCVVAGAARKPALSAAKLISMIFYGQRSGARDSTCALLDTATESRGQFSLCPESKGRRASGRYLATPVLDFLTPGAFIPGYAQTIAQSKKRGLVTRMSFCRASVAEFQSKRTVGTESGMRLGLLHVLRLCLKCSELLGRAARKSESQERLSTASERSVLRGGCATMDHRAEALCGFARTGILMKTICFYVIGFLKTMVMFVSAWIKESRSTICSYLRKQALRFTKNVQNTSQSACHTKWSTVRSITPCGTEDVFDIEVEGSHCFFANGMLVHNCHLLGADTACEVVNEHVDLGADVLGFSATPFGCGHMFDSGGLIFGADASEGRESGLIVPCYMKSCPEMDTTQIEKVKTSNGDWSEADIRKYCWTQAIYGYVFESMVQFNPEMKPFFLFAPGVEESVGFESHFRKQGIRVAHIDATDIVLDGSRYPSNRDVRRSILKEHEEGSVKGIVNRWVLREAVDAPWVEFVSLATPFGSLTTYLQVTGRALRASPKTGKLFATILDHGGNAWRFGSPNADRHAIFAEYFDDPDGARIAKEARLEAIRQEKEECPIACPKCGSVQLAMKTGLCYNCNHDLRGKSKRFVIQRDGQLIEVTGLPVKPRKQVRSPDMVDAWARAYWASKRKGGKLYGHTFAQLRGMIASGNFGGFEHLRGQWVANDAPMTPKDPSGWFRKTCDVQSMMLNQ